MFFPPVTQIECVVFHYCLLVHVCRLEEQSTLVDAGVCMSVPFSRVTISKPCLPEGETHDQEVWSIVDVRSLFELHAQVHHCLQLPLLSC